VVNSTIIDDGGNVTVGPFERPVTGITGSGFLSSTGALSGFGFTRRTLTAWPASPAAGDQFAWYNPDGTGRLWTTGTGDLLTVTSGGSATLGPFLRPVGGSGGGWFSTTGAFAGLGFVRRTLTSWPGDSTAPGDEFGWYNPDGTARLWTFGTGDVLKVQSTGELDLVGALRFPDGSLQMSAQVQGPAGPAGPRGPAGTNGAPGPQGPQGPAVHTSAACIQNVAGSVIGCGCQGRTIQAFFLTQGTNQSCSVTSDTGSCSANANVNPSLSGACCVCAP
jgi:hypothetical protein